MVNVDGSQNWEGIIKYGIDLLLVVGDHWERVHFLLGRSKSHKVILRHDWLKQHNPVIDWVEGKVEFKQCSAKCFPHPAGQTQWLWTKNPKASTLATEAILDTAFTNDGPTPDWASHYPSVFSEAKWDELPKSQPDFDIKIKFQEDPKHLSSKLYSLTQEVTVEMNRWIDEQLASGRIRPSKSPYASPFFYKREKDKLHPIIDYSRLNSYLVKDKFPLPRIHDCVDALRNAKIFSKIDAKGNPRPWKSGLRTSTGVPSSPCEDCLNPLSCGSGCRTHRRHSRGS